MPRKKLPDLKTLRVSEWFDIRAGDYSAKLVIKRRSNGIWYAEYLPAKEDDLRYKQGERRHAYRKSLDTKDPYEAAKLAVEWNQKHRRELLLKKDEHEGKYQQTLQDYWNTWFSKESDAKALENIQYPKWKRDVLQKWGSISEQQWAHIRVDLITRSHYEEYFQILQKQASDKNPEWTGSETKKQQKTLINKLLALAESDFVGHSFPSFPPISTQYQQVKHLKKEEWEKLIKTVIELSGGAAKESLTEKQYQNLEFKSHNRENQRNWVDLYDALYLEWFFFLRSENFPHLKIEWFKDIGDETIVCRLEKTKGNRDIQEVENYRPDASKFWKRLSKRRGKEGYLVLPHIKRQEEGGPEAKVVRTLNFLLKSALEKSFPNVDSELTWTNLRHTALRLTLEEMPELGIPPLINDFAANAGTSPQMLHETYLKYIQQGVTSKRARAKLKPSEWSLIRKSR